MNSRDKEILDGRLVPYVQQCEWRTGERFVMKEGASITVKAATELAAVQNFCRSYWGCKPMIRLESAPENLPPEGYRLQVSASEIVVEAGTERGLRYAFQTLRQLGESGRGERILSHYTFPPCCIEDFPKLEFRGIHLCYFPETKTFEIESALRLAAYYKFNYAVLEFWGVFSYEACPELAWSECRVSHDEIRRLVKLAKELGIELFPQFNILGHATASRVMSGKHSALDFHPELQPLFEPEGWSWCLSNEETRKLLTQIVLELYELFDRPKYFHLGCDEAYDVGSCSECRKRELSDLIAEHITYFYDLFAVRGVQVLIWHDMLLESGDPRWQHYIACGEKSQNLSELFKKLPKDLILADWQYGYPKKELGHEPSWPTADFFREHGFEVVLCPWQNPEGTRSLGHKAVSSHLKGILQTTWHTLCPQLPNILLAGAGAAWGSEQKGQRLNLHLHLRQVHQDMGIQQYRESGMTSYQLPPETFLN